ncbi:MAG: diguanylate cyclase [Firmicutes bacterium]|nr:diguanylate cyclase [Bacillota bacterium]
MGEKNWAYKILILLAVTALSVILFLSYQNYLNTKKILISENEVQCALIEKSVLHAIQNADLTAQALESQLNQEMEEYSRIMISKYRENPDVSTWNLTELKQQFGLYDIYIINDNLEVMRTTFKPDLGLNFKLFPNFAARLEDRLYGDNFTADRLDIAINSGNIKKYSYMPTGDHKYLLELSIDIDKTLPFLNGLDIASVTERITKQYPQVENILIYKMNKNGDEIREIRHLSYEGTKLKITEETRLIAKECILNNQTKSIAGQNGYEYSREFIPYLTFTETGKRDWWNSYVIEINYNPKELDTAVKEQRNLFASNIVMIILVFSGLVVTVGYWFRETEKSRNKLSTVINRTSEGYCMLSSDFRITEVNEALCKMVCYSPNELLGSHFNIILQEDNRQFWHHNKLLEPGRIHYRHELALKTKYSKVIYAVIKATIVKNKSGNVKYIFAFLSNVTKRKHMEEELRRLSLFDPLTKLLNRRYFEQRMNQCELEGLDSVGMIICDVDGLKLINDTLGHKQGDRLLESAATAIKSSLRENDVAARIGGDEFAVLLTESNVNQVEAVCAKIRDSVDKYNKEHADLPLSISVGYSFRKNKSMDMDRLFQEADNAMYREKIHHRQSTHSSVVQTLKKAMEARDFITDGHGERLQGLVEKLGVSAGVSNRVLKDLRLLAQFHDIGKVGVPDRILFKADKLTSGEEKEMKRHCEIGYRIAQSSTDLMPIADWILKHHEWWNGKGYPLGLKGEEIPIECRILSIADAYDAMTNNRPYRKALSHEEAIEELKLYAGKQFDPTLVKHFVKVLSVLN